MPKRVPEHTSTPTQTSPRRATMRSTWDAAPRLWKGIACTSPVKRPMSRGRTTSTRVVYGTSRSRTVDNGSRSYSSSPSASGRVDDGPYVLAVPEMKNSSST